MNRCAKNLTGPDTPAPWHGADYGRRRTNGRICDVVKAARIGVELSDFGAPSCYGRRGCERDVPRHDGEYFSKRGRRFESYRDIEQGVAYTVLFEC